MARAGKGLGDSRNIEKVFGNVVIRSVLGRSSRPGQSWSAMAEGSELDSRDTGTHPATCHCSFSSQC